MDVRDMETLTIFVIAVDDHTQIAVDLRVRDLRWLIY